MVSRPHVAFRADDRSYFAILKKDIHALAIGASFTEAKVGELDIIVAEPGLSGRPRHSQIWLGVECKNTGHTKNLLKEILGIRRELSLLQNDEPTRFPTWPRAMVPARPASCLMVYTTDQAVSGYSGPGEAFGIDFVHEPL